MTGLEVSANAAIAIAAASMVLTILTVVVTVIALFFTAKSIRSAANENKLTKELEREQMRETAAVEWLIAAGGHGRARRINRDGTEGAAFNTQVMAVAMLQNYPEAIPGMIAQKEIWSETAKDSELIGILHKKIDESIVIAQRLDSKNNSKKRHLK